jgi:Mg2+ and Co2+ transporter CorA
MLNHLCNLFPGLGAAKPSFLSLAHYPLQSAISDWMLYGLLMSRYIKYYEYSFPTVPSRLELFETDDLLDLHRWRRRCQQSLHKLQMTRQFVEHWRAKEQTPSQVREAPSDQLSNWDLLVMDLRYLEEQIEQHARSLEALSPIMTSLVQLIDSHKSIAQAEDIRRLTYIAIAFIPLTYITGLFSMSEPYGPGRKYFWVYWVAAVPTAAIVMGLLMLDSRIPALWKTLKEVFS